MKVTLKIFEKGEQILSKVLDEGNYRIGRSDFCDVILSGDGVSRSHAELKVSDGSVYVTNMSGAGKLKVNGKPAEAAEIQDGDELAIGPYRVSVIFGDADEGNALAAPSAEEGAPALNPNEMFAEQLDNQQAQVAAGENEQGGEVLGGDFVQAGGGSRVSNAVAAAQALPTEGTAALNRAETVVEMKPVVAKLLFTEGPRTGQEIMIETYEVSFGRSKKADIYLDDEKLSRIHAKVTRVGMGFRLIDMNSRNGTYVNGVRILEHPLSSFDTIELGNSKIKFLIHDMVLGDSNKGSMALDVRKPTAPPALDSTKSVQINNMPGGMVIEIEGAKRGNVPPQGPQEFYGANFPDNAKDKKKNLLRIAMVLALLGGIGYLLWPEAPKVDPNTKPSPAVDTATNTRPNEGPLPPMMSKEYLELTPDMQRAVEGYYTTALRAADRELWEEAVSNLKKIHEVLPYYKQSKDLLEQYAKKLKEKQIQEAAEKAKKDDKQELQILIQEGIDYLRDGEFDRAGDSFNAALNLDPNNQTAIKGLKAVNYRVRSLDKVPADVDPQKDKKKKLDELFEKAMGAFAAKSYQLAISYAQEIQRIEYTVDTSYLHNAQQIIDKSKVLQKEEFEPFLLRAKENYQEGDYTASRDLCEEMVKKDPAYTEATECVLKAKKQLNRLAREAYTHGYVLESLSRLEEAKQYWNRAKNYVRPGDEYYDKVMKKLEQYQ